ncbi:hypothetical protein [Nocardia sp. NPDC052566]|uniref:hypothetical protein n=1 Tax=Nocardia sp. NPDC052566 TaxID=3364330 RepID=UPI0037C81C40
MIEAELKARASESKPEHETEIADPRVIDVVLRQLGATPLIAFQKHCTNYRFTAGGRELVATLVTVPELDGTFLELESLVPESDTAAVLEDIRAILYELGIPDTDLTTERYSDAVLSARLQPTQQHATD